ncbi:MAG: anhydro-N-acetylmuramic acid kinase [Bacteroidetes bacterium]|nr:MAG: anhydro-N-acetylmuramic acid kinase [Bacteroidota bacterium]
MKQHTEQLLAIAHKNERTILGLMSGTSLDGLDLALCRISGTGFTTRVRLAHFDTAPYTDPFKAEVRRIFAQKTIDFQHLVLLNVVVANQQAAIIRETLKKWNIEPEEVDLIASHGQTVFHAPRQFHGLPEYPHGTLQIGDGDHIAYQTGIITLSDFRQKHLAAGGEGAPLALYGDYFLFSDSGEDRYLLNIGGIANFTFLPADGDPVKVFATDTGPGNTLLDAAAQQYFRQPFDAGAKLARSGVPDPEVLARYKSHPFFRLPFPQTTGPEQFSLEWAEQFKPLAPADLMATLSHLTAETIADAIRRVKGTSDKCAIYLSGGGAHNPLVCELLQQQLPGWKMAPMEELGIPGDAKEAVLFAILANESIAGEALPQVQLGGLPLIGMGKISYPG